MLKFIKLLQNIGTFNTESAASSLELDRLNLIYADNARGKTTLAAVLRSFATGDELPIAERHRFGSPHPPKVVLECKGYPTAVVFQNGKWNMTWPNLKVYDDIFVNENVHSGLDVDSQHRQNLHQLILGDKGVALNRELEAIVSRITQHNSELERKSRAIPDQVRGGLDLDAFCSLVKVPEIDKRIEEVERELILARDKAAIISGSKFETITLPELKVEEIERTLSTSLQDLDVAAETRVQEHLGTLDGSGESWVAQGMRHVESKADGKCPFCGQDISGLDLLNHYRAYFSEGYADLKRNITGSISEIERIHSGSAQASFERSVGTARGTAQAWAQYVEVPSIEADTEAITNEWNTAISTVTQLLRVKQAAPLETYEITADQLNAIGAYAARR